ncbi:MAG: anthranilate phosphoribosyltransferase [bacterium]
MSDSAEAQSRMRAYLQLVATGPELSKSLTTAQAEDALNMILDKQVDPVRSGIFLIALRMKRETDEENIGALNALLNLTLQATAKAPEIVAIADPFNGFLRGLPASPFLPAVLAACGLPSYLHGLHAAGPKYGITPHMVLSTAGKEVDQNVDQAAAALDRDNVGWAYLDQAQYIPKLHDLVSLRDTMVKRTCISTLEVVLKPLSGSQRTHLMTGFVHKAYPPVYAALAKQAGFDSAMIIRGVEGGSIPSLSQLSRFFSYHGTEKEKMHKLAPREVGIDQRQRMVPVPAEFEEMVLRSGFGATEVLAPLVARNVELGIAALNNKPGPMLDSLLYGAAIALSHTGRCEGLESGADVARKAIASGEAAARFNAA